MSGSGISEGSRENPGLVDYDILRESPARMFMLMSPVEARSGSLYMCSI